MLFLLHHAETGKLYVGVRFGAELSKGQVFPYSRYNILDFII